MTKRLAAALCGGVLLLAAQAATGAERHAAHKAKAHGVETGIASIYGYDGETTASGEKASPKGLTAAHKSLPFGTRVRVTNKNNGKSVTVRINDRGPFVTGRVIDLTPAGAKVLGFSGLTKVTLEITHG